MTASRLPLRFASTLSLLFALLGGNWALAADLPLRAFSATYKLYHGSRHVANTELRLEPAGDEWRWRMTTQARGIYALFVDRQPRAETRFALGAGGFRLQEILITDENRPNRQESARFDWQLGRVSVLRRGKQRELTLELDVYDYQSIHLLAASMPGRRQTEATIDFYHKGKLRRSSLVYDGEDTVEVSGEARAARVFEQTSPRSNSRIRYYYDAERPLLPLRIERLEDGERPSIMTLRRVDWGG